MNKYTIANHLWKRVQPMINDSSINAKEFDVLVFELKNKMLEANEKLDYDFITDYEVVVKEPIVEEVVEEVTQEEVVEEIKQMIVVNETEKPKRRWFWNK